MKNMLCFALGFMCTTAFIYGTIFSFKYYTVHKYIFIEKEQISISYSRYRKNSCKSKCIREMLEKGGKCECMTMEQIKTMFENKGEQSYEK